MKKLILPLLGTVAIAGSGTAAYFHFFKGAGSDALSPQAIAQVIPDDAYMAAFIATDEQTWKKLEKFGNPTAQKAIRQGLEDLQKKLSSETRVNFDQDIKPWVGNIMIAGLPGAPTKPTKDAEKQPNMLIVVGIKDKVGAANFANKLKSDSKLKSTETDYKGIKITDFADSNGSTYTAVLKDYIVIAPEQKTIEQAIDTLKGEPSLAAKPDAASLFKQSGEVQNPVLRIYMPDYATAMQQLLASNPEAAVLPPSTLEQMKRVKSIVATLGIDDNGLRLKAQTSFDPQAKAWKFKPTSGSIVSQFPADTFALISGAGANQYWTQLAEQANSTSEAQMTVGMMRQYTKMVGLDLDQDVFGWMDGDFALGMVPASEGMMAQVGFGIGMVFDTSNRSTAEATFKKLDALVQQNAVKVGQRKLGGKTVTEWQVPGQGTFLGHGWVDQDTVFVAIGQPVVESLANKPAQTLDSSEAFKSVTGSLAKQNNLGYFYLDMDKMMALMNQVNPASQQTMTPEAKAVIESIRGIGVTSTQVNDTSTQVEMLLSLKPAK